MKKQIISAISLSLLFASVYAGNGIKPLPVQSLKPPPGNASDLMVRRVYKVDSVLVLQPVVKFLGYSDDYYYFSVDIKNPTSSRINIVLTDKETNSTLYNEIFTDSSFTKKVAIPRESLMLRWDITNRSVSGKSSGRTYSLSAEVKLKEEVILTKL